MHNRLSEIIESQFKEVSIWKDDRSNKSELSMLFWNTLVLDFNIYLDG